ncbi:MAG TPA: metal ABC transporter substrate-binding protein [Kribbellaceae bacterium]|nr:metal ABC transporter substrate-binding protein [Kribbellaceae bacterium]
MSTRSLLGAGLAAAMLTLAGCGGASATGSSGKLDVVASFYPLEFVAKKIGGDRVDVTTLTAPGVEPHDLELTPKQVGSLGKAKLVVYEKGLQPAVDDAVEQNARDAGYDVSGDAELEPTGARFQEEGEKAHPGDLDPHFWLDPTRMSAVADGVAARLSAADPEGADGYKQRAEALKGELGALDGEFKAGLASCTLKVFVTSHEAFAYLAKRYGLEQVGIAGFTPDAEPSPARIKAVQDIVRQHHVTTIFYEELVSPKVAESVARDLHVQAAVLSPIEGLADASSTDDYLSLMRANLAALKKANSCS